MFLKVIACEVLFRELCACAAASVNQLDLEFLSQGYHDNPDIGIGQIQERVDAVPDGRYDAVLVGYGLCNTMLNGLRAGGTRLVLPRAHDCITFFLGSRERYDRHFKAAPGTYYYTSGWLEHRARGGERPPRRQGAGLGESRSYEELVQRYGEENARYLQETMDGWAAHYSRGVFIDFECSRHLPCKEQARKICTDRGWEFATVEGNLGLLQRFVDGPWEGADFLQAEPGQQVGPSYDAEIIQIEGT